MHPLHALPGVSRLFSLVFLTFSLCGLTHAAAVSYSTSATRSNPVSLHGATLGIGNVYIFAVAEAGLQKTQFYLDRTSGTPDMIESYVPFDFKGTASSGSAVAFNTATVANGVHTLTTLFSYKNGSTQTVTSTFTVGATTPPPASTRSLQISREPNRSTPAALNGSTLSESPAYIFLSPINGVRRVEFYVDAATAPAMVETVAPFDFARTASDGSAIAWLPTSLSTGTHTMRARVTLTGSSAIETLTSTFVVAATVPEEPEEPDDHCAPVICNQIKVGLPFELHFNTDAGHLVDGANVGTGFTYVLPSSHGAAYTKQNLFVDTTHGELGITTTPGIANQALNNHTNMLGVGFTGQAQTARISTRLVSPPNGTGKWEQAGLWFGYDEDHYFKLVYESSPAGNVVELLEEIAGKTVKTYRVPITVAPPAGVSLDFVVDPYNQKVTAYYALGSDDLTQIGASLSAPPEFFSFDAAGIDPQIGTRTFAGLFATNRNGANPLTYWFDHFSVTSTGTGNPGGPTTFTRTSHPLSYPTNMVWGPDNRLYVTEMFGNIHALTFDADLNVTQDQLIPSLVTANGKRLTLGITVDPASTASNVILWVSSSSPSTSAGALNSGTISKLSGAGFATVQNVITGLPRAISNHAPNSLHFGVDGRLYIAVGGNTGAGSPTDAPNEFGDRPEQALSAAIVVADVKAANFDGTCAPASLYDAAPCSVTTYATGLRNSYDFVFHSNGNMYATDNGLGVTGAYPPKPTPSCFGVGSSAAWNKGGHNPGTQPDLLHRIQANRYYGHPNPARGECVFKNGSHQGVAPLPGYTLPLASLGDHMSANGMIEYQGSRVCGAKGSLLIANYSLGQSISQITLSPSGLAVSSTKTLVSGLSGPLALAENPAGDIFVAELNTNVVTALRYSGATCVN